MCSMLKGTSSIAEQYESPVYTASEMIHELASCTDGKRLGMDASAINFDTDFVDSTNSFNTNSSTPYRMALENPLSLHDMPGKTSLPVQRTPENLTTPAARRENLPRCRG